MFLLVLVALIVILIVILDHYLLHYWTRRGFKQSAPVSVIGDMKTILTLKHSAGEFLQEIYEKFKEHKIFGIYASYIPMLVITDPKIVKDVLISDFTSFHDRIVIAHNGKEPLSSNLFTLSGKIWRDLRVKLSPTFTSGKLKGMFPIVKEVASVLDQYLVQNFEDKVDVFNFHDLMARFAINIVSSFFFGIDNDCINEPDHIIRKMGGKLFTPSIANGFKGAASFFLPNLFQNLGFKLFDTEVEKFFFNMVDETMEYREKNNYSRNDFMQLVIQLKNQGYVSVDRNDKEATSTVITESDKGVIMDSIYANSFVFFESHKTLSTTMSCCLYELARNKELQKKVQDEIDAVLKGEEITYDVLSELKYLEACIDETLRKYPIISFLFRSATRDYTFAGTDLTVEKGTGVMIPVLGFHRDPEIYDEPMKFKPERFLNSPTGGGKAEGVFYMPFGDGPRNCVGIRMSKVISMIGLTQILSKYSLELTDREMIDGEIEFNPKQSFFLTPLKPLNLKVVLRRK